ncbi:MAG: PhoH family protein [bacterium]|jgi:PhoH-like ATPase|nr:PhoH family protein [bacterium]
MRRTVILDTNVLLHDPRALYAFNGSRLVIPITVIAEIDKFKKGVGEVSRNAREASRQIDDLRRLGSLTQGVAMPEGGTLTVAGAGERIEFPEGLSPGLADDCILAIGLQYKAPRGWPKLFVTMDVNMRIKAGAYGLEATGFEDRRVRVDDLFQGYHLIQVPAGWIDEFFTVGHLDMEENSGLHPNEGVVLQDAERPERTALGTFQANPSRLHLLRTEDAGLGIRARNLGQHFALHFLLDETIQLVTLAGRAGTGKTLLALAAGLRQVLDEDSPYRRMVVSRPVFPMGKELGFLPGSLEEKLGPWMTPIHDNLEQLLDGLAGNGRKGQKLTEQKLRQSGVLEVEPLSYIRGRSLPRQFFIVDEVQNLTPHEVKTIITRAGNGTKVVLTGDPEQIDNPYVDAMSNGLSYVIDRFRDQSVSAHATLSKGERSRLAGLAAELL